MDSLKGALEAAGFGASTAFAGSASAAVVEVEKAPAKAIAPRKVRRAHKQKQRPVVETVTKVTVEAPDQFGKKTFNTDQTVCNIRFFINPSDLMKKRIKQFTNEREDKRFLILAAERTLGSVKLECDEAAYAGSTERDENDDARCYRAFDIRRLDLITYTNSSGMITTFTRVGDDAFERIIRKP